MSNIPNKIRQEIIKRLQKAEKEHNIEILFAIESGSRAWGFHSQNSDFDIRFVYKQKLNWYLSIQNQRDVIEYPIIDEIDLNGWDIRKALNLFAKSNPPFLEWVKSPITYIENGDFRQKIKKLEEDYFSKLSCIKHYFNMAKNNYREYLKKEIVRTKKYFYVLRPIMACEWIKKFNSPPPMEFGVLMKKIVQDKNLKKEIEILLKRKMAGEELDEGPANEVINKYLDEKIIFFTSYCANIKKNRIDLEYLNELFRKTIKNF